MTLYETLSLIVSAAGSLTIIVSLILVYRQTRIFAQQSEYLVHSITDNVAESLNTQSHEIGQIFVQYPELRPYFYHAQPIASDHPQYHRAEAVAELMLDIFWSMSTQSSRAMESLPSGFSRDARKLWEAYLTDSFSNAPILVEVLEKRQNWYGQDMLKLARASVAPVQ